MRKKIFTTFLCCTTLWMSMMAQEIANPTTGMGLSTNNSNWEFATPGTPEEPAVMPPPQKTASAFNHLAIGVELFSTTGFGLEVGTPLSPHFALRGGFSMLPYSYGATFDGVVDQSILEDIDNTIDIEPAIRSALAQKGLPTRATDVSTDMNVGVSLNPTGKILIDYYPSSKYTFHITAGAYFGSGKMIKLKGRMDEAVDVLNVLKDYGYDYLDDIYVIDDNYQLTGRDVMDIRGALKVNAVKPYFGLGFGRAVPKKRVGVNFEIGVVYHGTPKITSESQNIQRLIDNELSEVMDVLKDYPIYPIISFKLTVRLF